MVDGRKIKCTPNHKFRVYHNKNQKYEWLEAKNINHDYSLVMGIRGIVDNVDCNEKWAVISDIYKASREEYLAIARLLGFVLGDGNFINNDKTKLFVDTLYDTRLIASDLNLLDVNKDYTITDNNLNFTIEIGEKITRILNKFLILTKPIIPIPKILLNDDCPKSFIREFLAAYNGNDGVAPFLNWIDNKSELIGFNILRAINYNDSDCMNEILTDLKHLFRKFGISITINNKRYTHNNSNIYIFNTKINNIYEYSELIGYRYNIHKILRNEATRIYISYKNNIIKQHDELVNKTFEIYHDTNTSLEQSLLKAVETYDGIFLHKSSVPSYEYLYECIKDKCYKDVYTNIDAENFLKTFNLFDWFSPTACVINKVNLGVPIYHMSFMNMTKLKELEHVYDINVKDTHSFTANGIVVHNCIEPFTSNLYLRRTLAGEFTCINKYLIKDLTDLGIWSKELMEKLIYYKGSVQYIKEIPQHIKELYKTVWEIKQKSLIEMAADRAVYVCQSQSLNLFFDKPSYNKLTSAHFLGWKLGLKTGSYYIRSLAAIDAQNFTIDPEKEKQFEKEKQTDIVCPLRPKNSPDYEICEACSS